MAGEEDTGLPIGYTPPETPPPAAEPAPSPEAAPAPAPLAETPPAPEDRERGLRAALTEERRKRAESERRAEERFRVFEAQLAELAPKKPAVEPEIIVPDKDVDYIGHQNAINQLRERELNKLAGRAEKLEQVAETYQQREQREAHERQFVNAYSAAAREFVQEAPDFAEAYQYAVTTRRQQLGSMAEAGLFPREFVEEMAEDEERFLVSKAFQNGHNPAAVIYTLAKGMGYTGGRPTGQAPQPTLVQAPAPPALPQPVPPRDPSTGQFVPAAQARNPAPASLSSVPGSPGGQMTREGIANMSADERYKLLENGGWAKMWKDT